ncbi:head-to-tail stopper [Arthrobacter phage Popper]|uniref:Head-to-tail stopper n=1 Tax=Arthrobacter phage Popper TaxID=2859633 RepID=A0AAE7WDP6_9CAUD|nr:head-to-tail stopper [Arthrobacter phage Popper]QYC54930.1 head-to-tail stopper [Arthrobacter phage Popper]
MWSPTDWASADWQVDVVVLRGGGRDTRGNPLPVQEIPRRGVTVCPRSTQDPLDRSDVADSTAVLYDEDTTFHYQPTDRIRVPAGGRMAGDWSVSGLPGEWPMGSEIGLSK